MSVLTPCAMTGLLRNLFKWTLRKSTVSLTDTRVRCSLAAGCRAPVTDVAFPCQTLMLTMERAPSRGRVCSNLVPTSA